ncbi:MAG: response regulator [Candidatus Nitrohelix vancouverensis]|uniref:Response regulator n=1 Tax=Candidatus Nitrohelix vancouverensis TaxID=2705534 RepID=A0A7T0C1F5_9BACT|nr:MAG: response regulator [Candidatus Nitrohelix vancouverensis]
MKPKVLYVEDNKANLDLVKAIFRRRPELELISATDATVGIEMAQDQLPSLILMDINLPGMNGMDAFQRLREIQETQDIPVIALSANAMRSDIQACLDMGFAAYITKPIQIKEFLDKLDSILKP